MAGATTQAERQAQVLAAGYNGPLTDAAINQAYANAATSSDLAQSGISNTRQVSSPSNPTPTPTTVNAAAIAPNSAAALLGNSITQGANLLNSGSKQAFDEYVREFNANFGLNQSELNEKIRQFNEGQLVTQAGLTGMYAGQPTQAAQLQAFNEATTAAGLTGTYSPYAPGSYLKDAATGAIYGVTPSGQVAYIGDPNAIPPGAHIQSVTGLGGPVQAATGFYPSSMPGGIQGVPTQQAILQRANIAAQQAQTEQNWAQQYGYVPQFDASGNPVGAGGAPVSTLAAQQQTFAQQLAAIQAAASLQANPFRQQQVLGQLGPVLTGVGGVAGFSAPNTVAGVGTQGGTGPNTGLAYMQQMIDDIRNPGANQASMQGVLNAIPTPNKINSQDFLRSAPSTQNLVLQGMQERYGLDPADSLAQIKNTLPAFQSPTTFGTIKG